MYMRYTSFTRALLCAATLAIAALASPAAYAQDTPIAGPVPEGLTMIYASDGALDPHVVSGHTTTIQSRANGRYVSAELNYGGSNYGMLRARATKAAAWEQYTITGSGASWWIRSNANGRYVSTERNYAGSDNGMLRARATSVALWEKYYLYRQNSTGAYVFQSQANGRFVSAELAYTGARYGMLRARATAVGAWELFNLG
jgi:hypothetical protein